MKKIIGIVLALCMLFTMASAATIDAATATPDTTEYTVAITYEGLDSTAQATMLAYEVDDNATLEDFPAFVDTETTPIVGIDQSVADGSFSFKVADGYVGTIAVMIGGTDVAEPKAMLVKFETTSGGDDEETVEISFIWGDVDGDGTVSAADGIAIVNSTNGGTKTYGDYTIGVAVYEDVIYGDIDGDGTVSAADGIAVINSTNGGTKVYGDYTIGLPATFNVPKTQ